MRRGRYARTNKGGPLSGMALIAANALGLALVGWISAGELAAAHAVPVATVPDQPMPFPSGLGTVRPSGSPNTEDAR
ncbi:hypothetical protein ACFW0I_36500 [[Kitasatospora] papulosa]|uniref:hypothetical protein n=1 Tax=[Kitasatospora] papulosa TaxID=1464011 RepID=UPI0036998550